MVIYIFHTKAVYPWPPDRKLVNP